MHTSAWSRGFTLIELMIVVAIVGVISMVAYPSYQQHVLRTHRATAAACLHELALQMDRRFSTSMAFDQPAGLPAVACVNNINARYAIGFGVPPLPQPGAAPAPAGAPTPTTYRLEATPAGAQVQDVGCNTLWLEHDGLRGSTGAADVQFCWR